MDKIKFSGNNSAFELSVNDKVDVMYEFTKAYQEHYNSHVAIREAMCLDKQFPAMLCSIQEEDLISGRMEYLPIGFSPQRKGGLGFVYYMVKSSLNALYNDPEITDVNKKRLLDMTEYWEKEDTTVKVKNSYSEKMKRVLSRARKPFIVREFFRLAGIFLDYDKLVKIGIPGLLEEVEAFRLKAETESGDVELFAGMKMAINVLVKSCKYYAEQARYLSKIAADPKRQDQLLEMAQVMENITVNKPKSFREAIQLVWIYTLLTGAMEYGRMDVYLGDFLVSDIENGVLTEESALSLIESLWRLMVARRTVMDDRVVIGGMGRRNEKNADRFALLAMEASKRVKETTPQLTLRFYKGMNPDLMKKALDVIGEGTTYPMLYNDDINVDAVKAAFEVPFEDALDYVPLGCGEYVIDHKSFGTPSGMINLLKALEVTLHNGLDPVSGDIIGLQTGNFSDFETFDQLFDAYKKQVEYSVETIAEQEALEYKVAAENASFLFMSMLYDDCMKRGKAMLSGGVRYLEGKLESYGNINTSDSLYAIKEVVYEKKLLSQEELLRALDADFEGYGNIRALLLNVPKYGNDDEKVDAMAQEVHNHICNVTMEQARKFGLHCYLVVIINNQGNTTQGRNTSASADGRRAFTYMANANNPYSGMDKNGMTAMLNSLVKLDPAIHAGAVQNMKFSKELFTKQRDKLEGLLNTYFDKGGTQAMINVLNRDDLINALKDPEKYSNLIVRVGGFSARYVELPRDVQEEILNRTLY